MAGRRRSTAYGHNDLAMTSSGLGVGLGATLPRPSEPSFEAATTQPFPQELMPKYNINRWETTNKSHFADKTQAAKTLNTQWRALRPQPATTVNFATETLKKRVTTGVPPETLTPGQRPTEAKDAFVHDPTAQGFQLSVQEVKRKQQENDNKFCSRVQQATRPLVTDTVRAEELSPFQTSHQRIFHHNAVELSGPLAEPAVTWASVKQRKPEPRKYHSDPSGEESGANNGSRSNPPTQCDRTFQGRYLRNGSMNMPDATWMRPRGRARPLRSHAPVPYSGTTSVAKESYPNHGIQRPQMKEHTTLRQEGAEHPTQRVDLRYFDPSITYRTTYSMTHGTDHKWR